MKTKIIQNIKIIALALLLATGVSYVYAVGTWNDPTCPPPGCNTETPINVGTVSQSKNGVLGLFGLGLTGDFKFIPFGGTRPTSGQVLMADDSDLNNGKVKWGTLPTTGGGLKVYTFQTNYYTLMNNSEFIEWIKLIANGDAIRKPIGSGEQADEGWAGNFPESSWARADGEITANKLCEFFTGEKVVSYMTAAPLVTLSSGNNIFTRWNNVLNRWEIISSSNANSRDITSVTCSATDGIKRGSILQVKSESPRNGATIRTTYTP